jgi:hypothetical protein
MAKAAISGRVSAMLTIKMMDFLGESVEPKTIQEIADFLKCSFGEIETCADRLIESGKIQYVQIRWGHWGFIPYSKIG